LEIELSTNREFNRIKQFMKKITSIIFASIFCLSLFIHYSFATTDKEKEITIVIPAKVVAKFINDALPVEIAKHRKLSGVIRVKSVDKLKLEMNKVSFSVNVRGEDINYTGKIGNLPTSLSLGNIDTSFNCEASIRYDKDENILYVKPRVMEEGNRNEVLWLLLAALIGDKEYPVKIQKLEPIITRFSNKSATIDMDISNVFTAENRLFIAIRPALKKSNE